LSRDFGRLPLVWDDGSHVVGSSCGNVREMQHVGEWTPQVVEDDEDEKSNEGEDEELTITLGDFSMENILDFFYEQEDSDYESRRTRGVGELL
jgi:hypothetical protein